MKPKRAAFCDACSQGIRPDTQPVIVMGIDDGKGLRLPAELQERLFCSAECFWRWAEEHKPAIPEEIVFTEP
jgi:hypothetical protein